VPPLHPVEVVRLLFEARAAGNHRRVLALLDPEVELTAIVDGTTYHGLPAVRRYLRGGEDGSHTEVQAHRFVSDGDDVVVSGRVRVVAAGSLSDSPATWRLTVRDGRVARIVPVGAAARSVAA